jgi:hypothetical protein
MKIDITTKHQHFCNSHAKKRIEGKRLKSGYNMLQLNLSKKILLKYLGHNCPILAQRKDYMPEILEKLLMGHICPDLGL